MLLLLVFVAATTQAFLLPSPSLVHVAQARTKLARQTVTPTTTTRVTGAATNERADAVDPDSSSSSAKVEREGSEGGREGVLEGEREGMPRRVGGRKAVGRAHNVVETGLDGFIDGLTFLPSLLPQTYQGAVTLGPYKNGALVVALPKPTVTEAQVEAAVKAAGKKTCTRERRREAGREGGKKSGHMRLPKISARR